ncbi:invasion protein IagB [Pandoraea captiosa]|uniref:Invasion protein IagB n=1 Tax=Pandoraea captiosa TaxID=2508302 RepID=A0A5E4ZTF3_9BURK|nr:lytic transglycosylase domain-containing protein [Pandoraea captiosa]VVE64077.1 invasion protein IagB [Pandoraea captiosa]
MWLLMHRLRMRGMRVFGVVAISAIGLLHASRASADCWDVAAERYQLDPLLLYAIAQVESNLDMNARNTNRNGTYDIGLMQINSIHLPKLAQYGVTERHLREDACASIVTGAWILAGFVRQYGYGWEAVGAYNAGTGEARAPLRRRYADKVRKRYARLVAERTRRMALSACDGQDDIGACPNTTASQP